MYTIEVTDRQLEILINSTELYARIHIGQLFTILDEMIGKINNSDLEKIREYLRSCESLFRINEVDSRKFPQSNIAWDLYQVLRYKYSWDKHPEGGCTVNFNPPLKMGQEPLAKITKNE